MPLKIAMIERNAVITAFTAMFNKGANPNNAKINIYSSATSQPASPQNSVPASSVLLVQIPFSSVAFGSTGTETASANIPISGSIINSGEASWFRFIDGQSTPRALADGDITHSSGNGNIKFNNVNFVSGGVAVINSLSITMPE